MMQPGAIGAIGRVGLRAGGSEPNPLALASWLLFDRQGNLSPLVQSGATSMGWLFDSTGTLRARPHNLLLWSEQFDNAYWTKLGSTVSTNTSTAPNGQAVADALVEDTSTGNHAITRAVAGIEKSVPVTVSIRVQAGTRTRFRLRLNYYGGVVVAVNANLSDGSSSSAVAGAGTVVSSGLVSLGGGWFNLFVQGFSTVGGSGFDVDFFALDAAGNSSYTGTGGVACNIWGAQLNQGELQPYYPTTGAAFFGPRVSYDPANLSIGPFLLAEEARTNLLTWNTPNAAVPTGWQIGFSTGTFTHSMTAPLAGYGLLQNFIRHEQTTDGRSYIWLNVTLTENTTYTLSVLVNRAASSIAAGDQAIAHVSIAGVTGTTSLLLSSVSAATGVGQITFTTGAGGSAQIRLGLGCTFNSRGVVVFGGWMLEVGATRSSLIQTFGTAVTRSADNLSVTNLAATGFNAAGSTVYVDATTSNVGALIGFDDGTTNNRFRIGQNDVNVVFVSVFNGAVQNNQFVGTHPVGNRVRAAMRLVSNNFAGATNGVVQFKNAASSVPPVTRMTVGSAQAVVQLTNGRFFQAAIAPAISDSGLQRMTRI